MTFFFRILICVLSLAFASSVWADGSPIRWDDFVISETDAVLDQNLVTPISRRTADFTEVRSTQTAYTVGVGEVLYIPVWNETAEGAQIGMSWRLENKAPNIVSSVMVERLRPTHRSNQTTLGFAKDSTAPFYTVPAIEGIGCEERHGVSTQDFVRDNIVLENEPTAFICIQGQSTGETTLLVGERASIINRQQFYELTGTGGNVSIDNSYVNPNLSLEITINVVAGRARSKDALAYAPFVIGNSIPRTLIVRPINASFDSIPCRDLRVFVDVGTSLQLTPTVSSDCIYQLRDIRAPSMQFPPYFDNADINVRVEQEIEVTSGSDSAKVIRTAASFAHVIPSVDIGSRATAWARMACPTVLFPGARFGCKLRLADTTGSPPSDADFTLNLASLPAGGGFSYVGVLASDPSVICFEVRDTVNDLSTFAVSGVTTPGFRFRSQQIWLDARAEGMIGIPYSRDCRNAN